MEVQFDEAPDNY